MENVLEYITVTMILLNFLLLGSSSLGTHIKIMGIQGVLLGILPFFVGEANSLGRTTILALISISLKGMLFPVLLRYTARVVGVKKEISPLIGYPAGMIIGLFLLFVSFWLETKLSIHLSKLPMLFLPVALSTMFVGLFCIISRRLAMSQAIGYLIFENGIWMFGVGLVKQMPLILEIGLLLDVFVAVFILGIAIWEIKHEFEHVNVDQISSLKG